MKQPNAIVIGSGFGGLSAAIRLQASGFNTTILEQRDKPGGRAYVYKQDGFTFDAGPTVITAPHCIEEVFGEAGARLKDYVDLMPVTPFYRLQWHDGYQFDYSNDEASMRQQIEKRNVKDWPGYQNFYEYSQRVFAEGYEKLAHVPFLDFWSMLKVAPQLASLGAHRSVYSQVASYIKDEKLREAFSFHSLLVGGNPFSSSSIYTLIHYLERNWGVFFPRGGTSALVSAFVQVFKELGGALILNAKVDKIATDQNGSVKGVSLLDGEHVPSELVVSNADVTNTYARLLRDEPKAQRKALKLTKSRQSMSLFLIYFGTNRTYPELCHHTVLFGPRYKGLLKDIFSKGVIADDFSLYLHAPTRSDATLAPVGCDAFYVLAPVPHLGRAKLDWENIKNDYADRILAELEKQILPNLRQHLVSKKVFTPVDFENELSAYQGNAFSLEPLLTQSAYFRVHNRDENIKGLYFVGAGTHPGAGVPGVINSAKATHRVIMDDYSLRGDLVRRAVATPLRSTSPRKEYTV